MFLIKLQSVVLLVCAVCEVALGQTTVLRGHTEKVNWLVEWSKERFASASYDKTIRVWSFAGQERGVLRGHDDAVTTLARLPNNELASGSQNGIVIVWTEDGAARLKLSAYTNYVTSLEVLRDGRLASGCREGDIKLWNPKDGSLSQTLKMQKYNGIFKLVTLPNGDLASLGTFEGIRIWDVTNGAATEQFGFTKGLSSALSLLPNGQLVSGVGLMINIWDPQTRSVNKRLEGQTGYVTALTVKRNGELVSGGSDRSIRAWNVTTGSSRKISFETANDDPLTDIVNAVIELSNGKLVCSSSDKNVYILN